MRDDFSIWKGNNYSFGSRTVLERESSIWVHIVFVSCNFRDKYLLGCCASRVCLKRCYLIHFSDVPLSYGIMDVKVDPQKLNNIEFVWDASRDTGVYVKVNCISTEFTAKKHGGEKGVPFRVQAETYRNEEDNKKLIHCGSAQVKVFKV